MKLSTRNKRAATRRGWTVPNALIHTVVILALCSCLTIQEAAVAATLRTFNSREDFIAACRNLQGFKQSFSFENGYCLYGQGSELKISGVSFWGDVREHGYVGLLDSSSLLITFPTGAKAFGADFSSFTSQYRSTFMATMTVDSTSVSFAASTYPRHVFFGFIATGGFTNLVYDDGGGIWRTNFDGQAVLANPLMVLNHIPPPVLNIVHQPAPYLPGFTWSATNPGFAVQQSTDMVDTNWTIVSPRSSGCTDSWFLPTPPAKLAFYRLVFVPAF